jgi:hypothetical protein
MTMIVLGDNPLKWLFAIEDAVVWARRIMDVLDRKFPANHNDWLSNVSERTISFTEDRDPSS